MKQSTIFDYIQKISKEAKFQSNMILRKINNNLNQNEGLIKTYIQKSLSETIKEQEEYQKIKDLLGDSWFKQEKGFGFTDKSNIMILSTLQDFNDNFFNLYRFEDFELLTQNNLNIEDLKENKNKFFVINGVEYNSNYFLKAIQVLGKKSKISQHQKLKLLFLSNTKNAALICPKF